MDLVLVRHAEPVRLTAADTGGTPADPSLTDRGYEQAERLAAWLAHERFDAIYTSSKARAIETASPIEARLGLTPVVDDGWLEYDARSHDYIPMEEMRATKDPRLEAMYSGDWSSFGDADPDLFRRQVADALDRTIAKHGGQRVLIVCHGGVINVAVALVAGLDRDLWFEPDYTSISRIVASRGGVRSVVSVNETAHLFATRDIP
jgi:2,3-bisphosphoglycerate-dependent phosphoglycerate mutase